MRILLTVLLLLPVFVFSQSPVPEIKSYELCEGMKLLKDAAETNFMSVIKEEYDNSTTAYNSNIEIKGFSNNNGFNTKNVSINTLIGFITASGYSFHDDKAAATKFYKQIAAELSTCFNSKGTEAATDKNTSTSWKFTGLKDFTNSNYSVEIILETYYNNKLQKWAVNYTVFRKS